MTLAPLLYLQQATHLLLPKQLYAAARDGHRMSFGLQLILVIFYVLSP